MPGPPVFLGEFEHSLDDKGRLAVPARFRPALDDGLYITRGLRPPSHCATYPNVDHAVVTSASVRLSR